VKWKAAVEQPNMPEYTIGKLYNTAAYCSRHLKLPPRSNFPDVEEYLAR
jgi:hypothetical protein